MTMNKTESLLDKFNKMMGNEKELILLKGQFINPAKAKKKNSDDTYYTFGIKTLKKMGTDEYSQSFNTYQVIVPVERSKHYTDEQIKAFKNNEVLVLVESNCHIKRIGENGKVNNITLYLMDIMQTKEIIREIPDTKAVNL